MLELIGALTGGLFRLLPEVLKFLDAKSDRAHELARLDKQFEFQKLTGQQKIEEAVVDANAKFDVSALQMMAETMKAQFQVTGNSVIDFITMTLRPIVTYLFVLLYMASKVGMFVVVLQGGLDTWEAIVQLYTTEDRAILSGILTFWFLGRAFDKVGQSR
jgi:hypothetical protein